MELKEIIPEMVLASQSPARLSLLRNLGIKVKAIPTDCDESHCETEPDKTVELLAGRKLKSYMESKEFDPSLPAIACDTLLWFKGMLIGKAHSSEEAEKQIQMLAGQSHWVYSGYSLFFNGKVTSGWDRAKVTFREISPAELKTYIESQQWRGAAGSYHCDGLAKMFIESIEGDFNTVVGLPLLKVSDIIKTPS